MIIALACFLTFAASVAYVELALSARKASILRQAKDLCATGTLQARVAWLDEDALESAEQRALALRHLEEWCSERLSASDELEK